MSTDHVFDGARGAYGEEGMPNPFNLYGIIKLISEPVIREQVAGHLVVWPGEIYETDPLWNGPISRGVGSV